MLLRGWLFIIILMFSLAFIQDLNAQYNDVKIDYFGQTPPIDSAIVFAPDFISRKDWYVQNACFSHNGKEFVFVKTDSAWTRFSLMYTHYQSGKWTEPAELFPGEKNIGIPFFSYNDSILYFSNSLVDLYHEGDIYTSKRTATGWTKPEKLPPPINSEDGNEWEICESKNGTLYFSSTREGAKGVDNYMCKPENGKYLHAENLGETINTISLEECPYIAPDESFLIFNSWKYNPKYLGNNIYISYKNRNGKWSEVKDLGKSINTDDLDIYPYITPDGKYFMFTRRSYQKNTTYSKIYWISTAFLDKVKKSKDTFKPITLSTKDLDKYLGIYSNPQVPYKVEISKDKNILLLQSTGQQLVQLETIDKDRFSAGGFIIKFVIDKKEMIVSVRGGSELGRFTKEKK